MAKVKRFLFGLGIVIYSLILMLPSMAFAEEVYTESTIEVIAVDEETVTLYADQADADGESVQSSDITVYSSSVVYDQGTISSTYVDIAKGLVKYVYLLVKIMSLLGLVSMSIFLLLVILKQDFQALLKYGKLLLVATIPTIALLIIPILPFLFLSVMV